MRFQWRAFSFELPPGFEIQPEFTPPGPQAPPCACGQEHGDASAKCLTICKPAGPVTGTLPFSKNPDDLNPGTARVPIVLTSLKSRYVGPPLRHLQQTVQVLPEYLANFRVTTCEPCRIGNHPAARAHFSFETNFRIDQFTIAWHVADEVISATMTIPECDPESGWAILQPFVDTFRS